MANTRWKRVGKKSGPANVLANRWEVGRSGNGWSVLDHFNHVERVGYRSMAEAKVAAEALLAELPE